MSGGCQHHGCRSRVEVRHLGTCALHAVRAAVDNDDIAEAYALAADYGYPESTVRRAIRDAAEQLARVEAAAAAVRTRTVAA